MPEPMRLELYFAASRSFADAWHTAVRDAADQLLAAQGARELAGQEKATEIAHVRAEDFPDGPPDDMDVLSFRNSVPWPDQVPAGIDTIGVTFSFYVHREVQKRLDQRRGLCTLDRAHGAAECNGEHV